MAPSMSALLLGGTSSMMAAVCTHPLDTIKVRMQTMTTRSPNFLVTGWTMVRTEGPTSLYRGLSASLGRQATYSTTRFALTDYLKSRLAQQREDGVLTLGDRMTAAMTGGAVGGLAGTPMDVCNVRMQADNKNPPELRRGYKNVFNALQRIASEEGITALYAGLGPNLVRGMLMTAGQIVSYDLFKARLMQTFPDVFPDNIWTHFVASTGAGLVATLVTQPMDVVKTRMMNAKTGQRTGAVQCLVDIVRSEGAVALYKGTWPAFVRLGPHTTLTFIFLEQLRRVHAKLTSN
eukprot:m.101312 g.101312  ORF g.101312 m.101312 type:complete len:291 (-) comp13196_c0_seq2:70-942(-)